MSEISTDGTPNTYATTEQDAWPLIPEQVSSEVASGVVESSAALSLFRQLPDMSSRTYRMPVLNSLGSAAFTTTNTNDDLGGADVAGKAEGELPEEDAPALKKTHQMEWENVYLVAEPLAIILPIPEDVLEDSTFDLWAEMRPRMVEAFQKKIDDAIIWGQGRPDTWPSGIVPTAISRGLTVADGTGADLGIDTSNLMGELEEIGYDPNGWIADPSIKARLRNTRTSDGQLLFQPSMQAGIADQLWGEPISYVKNSSFLPDTSRLIAGKMDEAVFSIRSDMRFKILDQAVISSSDGIQINLPQQDMVALRIVMRLGWAVPNPIHQLRSDRSASYPFAVLTS